MQDTLERIGAMYAKIFTQIFDSSIAENYEVRHVFEDLLKLADKTGAVDMTMEAVARRTNVPLEKVRKAIVELLKPDQKSRTKEHEGRRLIPLDEGRDWGWLIVNYQHYRELQDEESRRATWRNAKAKQRAKLEDPIYEAAKDQEYQKRRKPGKRAMKLAGAKAGACQAINEGMDEANS